MKHLLAQQLTLPSGLTGKATIKGPANFAFATDPTLGAVLSVAIKIIFAFAGIGLLFMLLFGGFDFITSAGDAKKLEQGRQKITYAIMGFLIVFAAYWIMQVVGKIFGLESITSVFQ